MTSKLTAIETYEVVGALKKYLIDDGTGKDKHGNLIQYKRYPDGITDAMVAAECGVPVDEVTELRVRNFGQRKRGAGKSPYEYLKRDVVERIEKIEETIAKLATNVALQHSATMSRLETLEDNVTKPEANEAPAIKANGAYTITR